MQNNYTKTILFLINGLGVASKDSFDIKFNDVMPNLSSLMNNYIYSNLENTNYNYKNGYRNFSLGNDLLATYNQLQTDTNFDQNPKILSIAADANLNNTKIHLFCFLDNDQVISQVIKIINVLRTKGNFSIFIHIILRQKDIISYDKILTMIKNIQDKITLLKGVEIGIVGGERTVNKDEYYNLFSKEMGEKWPDYTRKINYSKQKQISPKELDSFYINPGFKVQQNDIALFLNYEDVDCSEFISKISNVKLYTLFPMKAFSYAINIYEEIPPKDYFNKKLIENNLKCLFLTTPERVTSINYNFNGLNDNKIPNIEFSDIRNNGLDISQILNGPYNLIVFDYDLDQFTEIAKMKDFLTMLDDKIDYIYNICDQNNYNMFIASLYGLYKEDYLVGYNKKVKLDYSIEVPVVMIDRQYQKSKYLLKYGNTYNLSNTIINSITHNPNIPTLIKKRGIIAFFKD